MADNGILGDYWTYLYEGWPGPTMPLPTFPVSRWTRS